MFEKMGAYGDWQELATGNDARSSQKVDWTSIAHQRAAAALQEHSQQGVPHLAFLSKILIGM